jgi:hypothetical protein
LVVNLTMVSERRTNERAKKEMNVSSSSISEPTWYIFFFVFLWWRAIKSTIRQRYVCSLWWTADRIGVLVKKCVLMICMSLDPKIIIMQRPPPPLRGVLIYM